MVDYQINSAEFSQQLSDVFVDSLDAGRVKGSPALTKLKKALEKMLNDSENLPPSNRAVVKTKLVTHQKKIKDEISKYREEITSDIYDIYKNAFNKDTFEDKFPGMVIGGDDLRASTSELLNFGTLSTGNPAVSKGVLKGLPTKSKGAILCDTSWSVLKNDAYMLGAIHAKKTFYAFAPGGKVDDSAIWGENEGRIRVMGRELAMLAASGYQQVATEEQIEKYGPVFVCLNHDLAEKSTLKGLAQAADNVNSIDKIRRFLAPSS